MHLRHLRKLVACGAMCITFGAARATPVVLDPPGIAASSNASTIVDVEVTAGPSGAPNGFTVEWMTRARFEQIGGWPADPADPNIHFAIFLGTPTLNTVDGTRTFLLSPGQIATVQLGDIFDETGVMSEHRDEMLSGTEYVFRVKANGDGGLSPGGTSLLPSSEYSLTEICLTKPHDDLDDCVHSQGYWKNHPGNWTVTSLKIGNIIYTKTQLLSILNEPANGNGLISLSHQLIAAKLNILAGAIAPAVITNAIATADAMIGVRVVPPVGSGYLAPSVTSNLNDVLEQFNTDERNHDCQTPTSARSRTWAEVKAIYR